jgi:hypothetical protein
MDEITDVATEDREVMNTVMDEVYRDFDLFDRMCEAKRDGDMDAYADLEDELWGDGCGFTVLPLEDHG